MAYKKNTGRPIEKTRLKRCCIYLENHGYSDVAITNSPTDLKGKKDGKDVNIEIKWTSKQKYFGAATFTEWRPTLKGEQVEFIVVKGSDSEDFDSWKYYTFSSEEFSKYSTIPPFKVNFNINLADLEKGKTIQMLYL